MISTKLRLDLQAENNLSQIVSDTSISSHQAGWQNITLEHFRNRPVEVPECTFAHHTIIIHFKSEPSLERSIDNRYRHESINQGDIVIVPADASFAVKPQSEAEGLFLSIAPKLLDRLAGEAVGSDRVELQPSFARQDPLIYQIGLALKQELETDYRGTSLYIESLCNCLATHLLRHYTSTKLNTSVSGKFDNYKIKQAVEYINANFSESIKVEEVAKVVDISQYYFCHLFKQSTGITPYQYIIRQRVAKAKKLLVHKDLIPIVDISLECGFSSQSQMTYHFRKCVGLTPKVYRNKLI